MKSQASQENIESIETACREFSRSLKNYKKEFRISNENNLEQKIIEEIGFIQSELLQANVLLVESEKNYNLSRAAEIKYGILIELENKLRQKKISLIGLAKQDLLAKNIRNLLLDHLAHEKKFIRRFQELIDPDLNSRASQVWKLLIYSDNQIEFNKESQAFFNEISDDWKTNNQYIAILVLRSLAEWKGFLTATEWFNESNNLPNSKIKIEENNQENFDSFTLSSSQIKSKFNKNFSGNRVAKAQKKLNTINKKTLSLLQKTSIFILVFSALFFVNYLTRIMVLSYNKSNPETPLKSKT